MTEGCLKQGNSCKQSAGSETGSGFGAFFIGAENQAGRSESKIINSCAKIRENKTEGEYYDGFKEENQNI